MDPKMHHRQEMEGRIRVFETECDKAIDNIQSLKAQARSFLENLPHDKSELKERFLSSMNMLNEYLYHITELNVTLDGVEKHMNTESEPNISKYPVLTPTMSVNVRETSISGPTEEKTNMTYQTQHTLTHATCESTEHHTDQISCEDVAADSRMEVPDPVCISLPPQPKLPPGSTLQATIMSADGANLWIVEHADVFVKLTEEMTEYYKKQQDAYRADIPAFNLCAYYDEDGTNSYFRALHIKTEMDMELAEVYLLDTGESLRAPATLLSALAPRFCVTPPLARCCHLAGVQLPAEDELQERQTKFLNQYLWQQLTVRLETETDDETMESLGVYVYLKDGTTLNDRLMEELFSNSATDIFVPSNDAFPHHVANGIQESHPDLKQPQDTDDSADLDDELYSENPEYENPVEAVTGYDNRDEVDICKHYRGGEGCFKGNRCKKRHVAIHPDGWTLDRVAVPGKIRAATLPAPGTCHKVKVTHVVDASRFYVHFEHGEDELMTLADLVEEMTLAGANAGRLKLEPGLGEVVSARFSDGRWYRARVGGHTERGTIEVIYIDFGNEAEVSIADVTSLEPRWLSLPAQAVACRLAGVKMAARHADAFKDMVLDNTMEARIIARGFDELTVELTDQEGFSVADQLSLITDTTPEPYQVEEDSRRLTLHVPA